MPDDEQRNCPKHVEFYSKNELEKLVHLVGFITRVRMEIYVYLTEVQWGNSGAFVGLSAEDIMKIINSFPKFIFVRNQRTDKES